MQGSGVLTHHRLCRANVQELSPKVIKGQAAVSIAQVIKKGQPTW